MGGLLRQSAHVRITLTVLYIYMPFTSLFAFRAVRQLPCKLGTRSTPAAGWGRVNLLKLTYTGTQPPKMQGETCSVTTYPCGTV